MKDMDFINEDVDRLKAKEKYNKIVEENIKALRNNEENELKDPDRNSNYDIEIDGLMISKTLFVVEN